MPRRDARDSATGPTRWRSAGASHVGVVRVLNEDGWLSRPDLGLWAVADGMGGHEAGDYASRVVIEALGQLAPPATLADAVESTRACLSEANRQLRREAASRGSRIIGSTVLALVGIGEDYVCLWAGDSRLYLLRDGVLTRISHDHSQVQELVDSGVIGSEEAERHPAANIITRAVGAGEELDLEERRGRACPGDRFLLCTDGLFKAISEAEVAEILGGRNCMDVPDRLIAQALARQAADNVTAVTVACDAAGGASDRRGTPGP